MNAPVTKGEYLLRSSSSTIYVGQAANVDVRLLAQKQGHTTTSRCIDRNAASEFSVERIPDGPERARRGRDLIQSLGPICSDQA